MFFVLTANLSFNANALYRVEPDNPIAGEPIQLYYFGCEPPFPHTESNELFYIEISDDLSQFVGFYNFSLPLCPIRYEEYYDLGVFDEGAYTLEVYVALAIEQLPLNLDNRPANEVINFNVSGSISPVSVPTLNKYSIIYLLFFILFSTILIKKKEFL